MSISSAWIVAERNPDRLGVVSADGQSVTYQALIERSNQYSRAMQSIGLSAGDRVAIIMENTPTAVELVLAVMQNGMYLVPINYHSTASDIAYIVRDSDARAVFTDYEYATQCRKALDELDYPNSRRFCTVDVPGFIPCESWCEGFSTQRPEPTRAGAVMNYTSGTTGHPKGVLRPLPREDADTAANRQIWVLALFGMEVGPGVHLVNSPLYHTAVMNIAFASLHSGQTMVLMNDWEPELALQLIERYRITSTHMVATHFHRLLSLPQAVRTNYDHSSLAYVIHGAVPTPVDIKRRMLEWWGPVIYEYYGSSEVGGTLATPEHWLSKPGTVGRPFSITELLILDDDGQEMPVGKPGWVYMCQGDDLFEYHKDKEKTARNRFGRFICVGDIGYVDEDGDLFLCGRDAEIIISGGVNIYPSAIEGHLLSHEAVADVAVIGIPDPEFGEQVKAVVRLKPGCQANGTMETALLNFCREGLSHQIVPKSVDFVRDLPRDPSGKLYKQRIRERYWQQEERSI